MGFLLLVAVALSLQMLPSAASPKLNRWQELVRLIRLLAPIAAAYDEDGLETLTLNTPDIIHYTTANMRQHLAQLADTPPCGGTPLGKRLDQFFSHIDPTIKPLSKPISLYVITDGQPVRSGLDAGGTSRCSA